MKHQSSFAGYRSGLGRSLAVVAAVALLAACSPSGTPSDEGDGATTTVRFLSASNLKDTPYAPLTSVPNALGYWEDEGIKVEFSQITGGAAAFQALATGQADMVFAGTSTWFSFLGQGADIISVCDTSTKFINTPMVPQDSSIRSIRDLAGKTVAVTSLEASQIPIIVAMLQSVGLSRDDVTFVAIEPGQAAIAAYNNRQVDAFGYFDAPHAAMDSILKERGSGLRALEIPQRYNDLSFQAGIFVRPDYLEANQDVVISVLRGIAKGFVFTQASPENAVKVHWKVYPESKPVGGDEATNLASAVNLVSARLANSQPIDGKYCNTPPQSATNEMQVLLDAGVLKDPIDAESHVNNTLIDAVNAFDRDEIARQAETWSP